MPLFDVARTQQLEALFRAPRERRDAAWVRSLYDAAPDASLAAREQQVIRGPDGFGYFALYLPESGQPFEAFCIRHVLDFCLENGFGVVLNPDKDRPDWVFRYGHLWSLKAYDTFDRSGAGETSAPAPQPSDARPPDNRQVLIGAPSAEFFPAYARAVLRRYLQHVGLSEPKVFSLVDPASVPSQSLVFNLFPEDLASPEQFGETMSRLTWFLPPHYGLVSVPRGEYDEHFEAI